MTVPVRKSSKKRKKFDFKEVNNDIKNRIGINIKVLRDNNRISQKNLASATYIPASTLSDYENGKILPSIYTLNTLAQYFHVSIDYIVNVEIKPVNYNNNIPYTNEIEFNNIVYAKYCNIDQYYLYHFRTKDGCSKDIVQGYLTIVRDEERKVHRVEAVLKKEIDYMYNGTLIISGVYTYIYLTGRYMDRALLILPDPKSHNCYIGGLGIILNTSEGYEHSLPCVQNILLSSKEIPKGLYNHVDCILRLPTITDCNIIKVDKSYDKEAYNFLKNIL